jgi:sterol desaturase/sphingolipid hydroxylase (fatty acid hydroxylase superfamily)
MLRLARYYGDFFTVPIMVAAAVYLAGVAWPTAAYAAAGFLMWTLIEYGVHRSLHDAAGVPRRAHERHHANPASIEAERSSLTTPLIACAIAAVLVLLLGISAGCGVLAGLLSGYFAFIFVHHAAHRWTVYPTSPLYGARRRHALHHHRGPGHYGVTTPLWDIVFRTYRN